MTKRRWLSNVNNVGNDSHVGDSNNNGNSDGDGGGDGNSNSGGYGNSDDAAAAANGDNMGDKEGGYLRTAIGQWQLDKDNGMTMMLRQWAASNTQNACKHCTTHLRQQSTNVDSLGGGDMKERQIVFQLLG